MERSLKWNDGKFEFKDSVGVFYRYQLNYRKNETDIREYVFDTLQYRLIDFKEYALTGDNRKNHSNYYRRKKSDYGCGGGNVYKKTDSAKEIFMPKIVLGKTQKKFNNVFEIDGGKLICELWHVKHGNDKFSIESAQILEVDIETKECTPLIKGKFSYLSYDNRYLLYHSQGDNSYRYGVYDIVKREIAYKFTNERAEWIVE
ncbi:MAG: hypothetical protein MJZ61_08625 [Bacteroidales bacterium]|nr:hypothetical protein [Bacteroidales bacterium]